MQNNDFEKELSLGDIIRIFKRRFLTFCLIFIIIIASTLIYLLFFTEKVYNAEMTIEFLSADRQGPSIPANLAGLAGMAGVSMPRSSSSIDNELRRMKMDIVIQKLIDEMNLLEIMKLDNPDLTERRLISNLKNDLKIEIVQGTNFIKISYEHTDPIYAENLISNYYNAYLSFTREEAMKNIEETLSRIEPIYDVTSERYHEFQKKVIDFELENKISSSVDTVKPLLDKYINLQTDLLELDRMRKESKLEIEHFERNYLNVTPDIKEQISIQKNQTLNNLKNQIISKNIQLETLKLTSPNSPRIGELQTEINVLDRNYQETLKLTLQDNLIYLTNISPELFQHYINLQTAYESIEIYAVTIRELMGVIDFEIVSKSPVLYEYFQLKRDQRVIQTQYEVLKSAYEEAHFEKLLYIDKYRIINPSFIPEEPIGPNRRLNAMIGGVLAIFLGILGVFIKEMMDKKIKDIYEFESMFHSPEIKLKQDSQVDHIIRYIHKTKFNKISIINLTNNEKLNKQLIDSLKIIDNEFQILEFHENTSNKESIENYETFNSSKKSLIFFSSEDFNEYSGYKNYLDKTVIIIKEKETLLEKIEEISKQIENKIYVYIFYKK